ncbi:hypothetical protein EJ05DRAFT_476992 [Pseudovirgaria hyperparasitica]|uniref:Uncharacterized protein n=1 Tax=Pseudovirgaria hyperparasitica TaxID=470096 RepID=A0A6A6W4I6_9PEZI|nr:uncharacterized protein EJ05DRAFT_476992 [Pseudovirgaria hyperparasitica]KAF2757782.1 hypothetical protein EJ05DRAFT_476992 [Pseudovirgaria hyperparasitica]
MNAATLRWTNANRGRCSWTMVFVCVCVNQCCVYGLPAHVQAQLSSADHHQLGSV